MISRLATIMTKEGILKGDIIDKEKDKIHKGQLDWTNGLQKYCMDNIEGRSLLLQIRPRGNGLSNKILKRKRRA